MLVKTIPDHSATPLMIVDACTCPEVEGRQANLFYWRFLSECQYGTRMVLSYTFGFLSLIAWICVNAPQLYLQLVNQRADGISMIFLALWLAGDVLYVIGSFLSHALPTTRFLSVWYTASGTVTVLQTLWYTHFRERFIEKQEMKRRCRERDLPVRPREGEDSIDVALREQIATTSKEEAVRAVNSPPEKTFKRGVFITTVVSIVLAGVAMWVMYIIVSGVNRLHMDLSQVEKVCGSQGSFDKKHWSYILGQSMAYVNIPFYVGSRPAQIFKNWKRKSAEGVSFAFFFLALIGNTMQTLSIFVNDPTPTDPTTTYSSYLIGQIPFICSSTGVLVLDLTILLQIALYRNKSKSNLISDATSGAVDGDVEIASGTDTETKSAADLDQ